MLNLPGLSLNLPGVFQEIDIDLNLLAFRKNLNFLSEIFFIVKTRLKKDPLHGPFFFHANTA